MKRPMFTPEELEELRRADEELDESFVQTQDEIRESRARDRQAQLDQMTPEKRKRAAYQRAYREANREDIAAKQRAWQKNNREKRNAYLREYRKRKKLQQQTTEPSG